MRKAEVKISALLRLVQRDYLDNERKSKIHIDGHIERQLDPYFGERSAERLRSQDVEEYKDKRLAEGASRSTINRELSVLSRAGVLGRKRDLIQKWPRIFLYPVGNSNRRTGFFEHEDYLAVLAACLPAQKYILRFAYNTGWRRGEILGLRWDCNYDEAGKAIRIYTSKNGKGRTLPLNVSEECAAIIEERKQLRVKDCPYIFHYKGRQYNENTFNLHWREACLKAGVDRHFHDLRRTVVRNLTRAGVHRTIAKLITGHESDMVFERYDIVDERDLKDALTKMSLHINGQKQNGNGELPVMEATQQGLASPEHHTPIVEFSPSVTGIAASSVQARASSGGIHNPTLAENTTEYKELQAIKQEYLVVHEKADGISGYITKLLSILRRKDGNE